MGREDTLVFDRALLWLIQALVERGVRAAGPGGRSTVGLMTALDLFMR